MKKNEFCRIFKNRNLNWANKIDIELTENYADIKILVTMPAIIVSTLLFPIYLLMGGFGNFKILTREYGDLYYQKARGKYISDRIYKYKNDKENKYFNEIYESLTNSN